MTVRSGVTGRGRAAGGMGQKSPQDAILRVPAQTLTIEGWLPQQTANGQHGHWTTRRRIHDEAAVRAYWHARANGWERIDHPARLDIVLVFPVRRRRDTDNLYSRVKGLVDGLVKGQFIADDSSDVLDLHVSARVEPGRRAVVVTLGGKE